MNDLLEAARRALQNAHAPYSGFRVGAALRTVSGMIHAGANVENASFPEGNCAETSAIAAMVAAGERRIAEALVLAGGDRLCTPCGGCRQRLAEFAGPELPIHLSGPEGLRQTVRLGEILPLSFALHGADGATSPPARAVDVVRARAPGLKPRVGLVLGSGLGSLADAIEDGVVIAYEDLPGFPRPSVEGHVGRLILGWLEGVPVACLQGRVHLYEGVSVAVVNRLVRTLAELGCEILVLTNASGSLTTEIPAGSLALLSDHINMLGTNPLIGANDERIGPRFPDMSAVYDADLRARSRRVAAALKIPLPSGVYLATLGPSFETPAEIRAFRGLGADLVGMSTVPEAISARHIGMRVLAFSIVTNLAAGLTDEPLSHDDTLVRATAAAGSLEQLLRGVLRELA